MIKVLTNNNPKPPAEYNNSNPVSLMHDIEEKIISLVAEIKHWEEKPGSNVTAYEKD